MKRFRHIPPFQYLLGFEASARLGSFSAAADELGLTQSAISHQIRLLEERVGQPLFIRNGRGITLNDAGLNYWRSVTASFETLDAGYDRLAPYSKKNSVIVYMPRDFGALWMMPRLPVLNKALPMCQPWIDTSDKVVDFNEINVDVAIVRARDPDAKMEWFEIARDQRMPVLAPSLASGHNLTIDELKTLPRLHDERTEGWRDWFEMMGVDVPDVAQGFDFSDPDLALGAAEAGMGAALASCPLISEHLKSGRLIAPFEKPLDTGFRWFAYTEEATLADTNVAAFWEWLKSMAQSAEIH